MFQIEVKDNKNDDNLDACFSENSQTLGKCVLDCNNDTTCEAGCVSTFKTDYAECPCQNKCPLGCPCDNYECELPDKQAILTLYNSGSTAKPALLIQPNGEENNLLLNLNLSKYTPK